ncbi:nucleoside-diphosphate kinase [Archaeoglobus profundus]|uniref:Nucleoside diphosphate kinase n=1 Tax=Archaeoglobus profundus (strain DSM 5631 / JCM 9629 / NBRC 100127 / Av18) TaxID=572546 RepID=D2RGY9_ARCPA|nr:nucleoside-diphosphate kinase [Archaeoglobus profundus]ADB57564.1 Nucleoside-diphosphate kinase [Archaeoglobus profundus DSM 5631]
MERTFVMIKPDGVQRCLIGEIISRLEKKGLKIVAMKMMKIERDLAERHYAEHKGKPFFESLVSYVTSGPVVAMVVEGKNAIKIVRTLVGATNPAEAAPGTIRGDFGMEVGRNVIHASDSPESAEREIALFFKPDEIVEYRRIDEDWLYE